MTFKTETIVWQSFGTTGSKCFFGLPSDSDTPWQLSRAVANSDEGSENSNYNHFWKNFLRNLNIVSEKLDLCSNDTVALFYCSISKQLRKIIATEKPTLALDILSRPRAIGSAPPDPVAPPRDRPLPLGAHWLALRAVGEGPGLGVASYHVHDLVRKVKHRAHYSCETKPCAWLQLGQFPNSHLDWQTCPITHQLVSF